MTFTDISVLFFLLVFTLSGYIINFIRGEKGVNIQYRNDMQSLAWFRFLVPFGLVSSIAFYFSDIGKLSDSIVFVIIGCLLIITGLLIRWWSVLSLGNEFNVSLLIIKNHRLKTSGIYGLIRHPSYTGLLIYYIGLAVIMQNIFSVVILIVFPAIAVINRIGKEEMLLSDYFKESYDVYCRNTKKLIPYIY